MFGVDEEHSQTALTLLRDIYYLHYSHFLFEISRAHTGTCEWIFQNDIFKTWANEPRSGLICYYGKPGSGKSVLTRFIVESLKLKSQPVSQFQFLSKSAIAYHVCSEQDKRRGSVIAVLRSFIHQLLLEQLSLANVIKYTAAK